MRIIAEVLDTADIQNENQQTVIEITNGSGEFESSATITAKEGVVTEYDGVAILPDEAIEALKKAGFDTGQVDGTERMYPWKIMIARVGTDIYDNVISHFDFGGTYWEAEQQVKHLYHLLTLDKREADKWDTESGSMYIEIQQNGFLVMAKY